MAISKLSNPLSMAPEELVATRVKNPWLNSLVRGGNHREKRGSGGGWPGSRGDFTFSVGSRCAAPVAFLAWMADCSLRRLGEREI